MSSGKLFINGTLDSDEMIIVSFNSFANNSYMEGIPPFGFVNTIQRTFPQYDRIFFADRSNTWWHSGITDETYSIQETIEYLRNIISGYKKVFFMGSSCGGYGALLFGSILNITGILAFCPQTEITKYAHIDNFYVDVDPFINQKTKYLIYGDPEIECGDWHQDVLCKRICQFRKNVKYIPVNGSAYMTGFKNKEDLDLIFKNFFEDPDKYIS
jgi:hypothetical protein